jgi:hypothetical protein
MAITLGDHFMNLALTEFDHLARRVESTLRAPSVLADEKPVAVFPRVDELRDVLIPLLDWCVGRRPSAARGIVGIAAPCGAGKTLLLSWLAATAWAGPDAVCFRCFGRLSLPKRCARQPLRD